MKKHHGYLLLEILIALSIFSALLLSSEMMIDHCYTRTYGMGYFLKANHLLESLAMRLTQSPSSDASVVIQRFQQTVALQLPKGRGLVQRNGAGYHIQVKWGAENTDCGVNLNFSQGCIESDV